VKYSHTEDLCFDAMLWVQQVFHKKLNSFSLTFHTCKSVKI